MLIHSGSPWVPKTPGGCCHRLLLLLMGGPWEDSVGPWEEFSSGVLGPVHVLQTQLLPCPHIRLEPCAVVLGGLFSASLLSVPPSFRAGSAMAVSHPPRAECPSVTSVKDINQGQARSRTRPCVSVLPSAAKLSFLDHCLSSKNQYHASHTVWFPTLHEAGRDGSG